MPKFAVALLVVYSLLIVTIAAPAQAQPRVKPDENAIAENTRTASELPPPNTVSESKPARKTVDFKKVIDEETKRFNADTAKFDPVKIERDKAKQAQKSGWSKTQTTMVVVFAVGIAVLVVLLLKYGKNCAETSIPHCNIGLDDNCYCERYEDEKANRPAAR